tara:strand:- start:51980 stop:52540 length:561 start_codon:yes stop_codon:yes gene_type:complete
MIWLLLSCFLSKPLIETASIDSAPSDFYPVFEDCENTLESTACDFTGINSLNEKQSLYEFYKKPIVLDFSAMWCGPCNQAASEVEELYRLYEKEDLVYLTVLIENRQGQPPTSDDIKWWLEEWGIIESPVLGSDRSLLNNGETSGWFLGGWPTFYFINKDMKIQGYLRGYSKEAVVDGIEKIIEEQ